MKIGRTSQVFRPYYVNGYCINNIIFYYEGVEQLSLDHGWVETFDKELDFSKDLISIDIDEPKRTIKLNLEKKKNFIIKSKKQNFTSEVNYTLYIYAEPKLLKEKIKWEDKYQKSYTKLYSVLLKGIISVYDREENGQTIYKDQAVNSIIVEQYSGTIRTARGREADKIADCFKKKGIWNDVSHYNIEKILEHATIDLKCSKCKQKLQCATNIEG